MFETGSKPGPLNVDIEPCSNGNCSAIKHDQTLVIKHLVTKHFPGYTPCFKMLDKIWMPTKIWSQNVKHLVWTVIKHVWYRLPLSTTCWTVCDHQTFPVWTGLNDYAQDSRLSGLGLSPGRGHSGVLGKNILLSWCLSPPRCTKDIRVSACELYAAEGGREKGAFPR